MREFRAMQAMGNGSGLAFKPEHIIPLLMERPEVQWLELHLEEQPHVGGIYEYHLQKLAELYPLSIHISTLNLESWPLLDYRALRELKDTIERYGAFSTHIAVDYLRMSEQSIGTVALALSSMQEILESPVTAHPVSALRVPLDSRLLMLIKELALQSGTRVMFDVKPLVDFLLASNTSLASLTRLFPPTIIECLCFGMRERSDLSHTQALAACAKLRASYVSVPSLLDATKTEYDCAAIGSCIAQIESLAQPRLQRSLAA